MPQRDTRTELKPNHKHKIIKSGSTLLTFDKAHDRYDLPNVMDFHLPKHTELQTGSS